LNSGLRDILSQDLLEGGILMAPKTKYTETPNLFSFRRDKKSWALFSLIAKIKGTSPTEIFDETVDRYIEANHDIVAALPNDNKDAAAKKLSE
jgi:hypothetical protein